MADHTPSAAYALRLRWERLRLAVSEWWWGFPIRRFFLARRTFPKNYGLALLWRWAKEKP